MSVTTSKLLKVLEKAKNDSEKFAALLLLTKSVKAEELCEVDKKKIFKSIGFSFPLRLMSSFSQDDGKVLFNIGISIFSTFCSVKSLIAPEEFEDVFEKVIDFLNGLSSVDEVNIDSLKDIISVVLCNDDIPLDSILFELSSIKTVSEVIFKTNHDEVQLGFFKILNVILEKKNSIWRDCRSYLIDFLKRLCEDIKSRKDKHKFILISNLAVMFSSFSHTNSDVYLESWLDDIKLTLYEIFSNRLTPVERNPALHLSCNLIRHFGFSKLLTKREKSDKFHILVVRLACIEIAMAFRDNSSSENSNCFKDLNFELLISCFHIYESCCTVIADFDQDSNQCDVFSFSDIQMIENSLNEVAKLMSEVLNESLICGTWNEPLMLACFRAIGSWLNVEYFAGKKTAVEFAPTFVAYVKKSFGEPNDLIKVVSSVTMTFCEVDSIVEVLKKDNFFEFLCAKICKWGIELNEETYQLLCQTLMALILKLDVDTKLNQILLSLYSQCKSHRNNFVKYFYISTLTLFVLNKSSKVAVENQCREFVQGLTSFLQTIHTTDGKTIDVSTRYHDQWDQVEDLWPITMKELAVAIQNNGFVLLDSVKQSGFVDKISHLQKIFIDQGDSSSDVQYHYKMMCNSFLNLTTS